mgnify:FL=1
MATGPWRVPRDENMIVNVQNVIDDLERRQNRAVREAILRGDMKRLKAIDEDVTWLLALQRKRAGAVQAPAGHAAVRTAQRTMYQRTLAWFKRIGM